VIQPVQRSHRVAFAKDVVIQVIGGDALVLNLQHETVFSLNPTGARIAELIGQELSLDAVIDTLCHEYGVERHEVAPDVHELVDALLIRGLVVRLPDKGAA
jgi:hypothetical protein